VLLYPAEDSQTIIRKRLLGITAAFQIDLESLPLYVATSAGLRLDVDTDLQKLRNTVQKLRPTLLVLDPFVRLHNIDENASGEVAKLLGHLRSLQRSFGVAVAVVHHSKKSAGGARAGQALRGSSEFHAWGDSNIYLRRTKQQDISLTLEHRAEAAPDDILIRLTDSQQPHLQIIGLASESLPQKVSTLERVRSAIALSETPISSTQLRQSLPIRHSSITHAIRELLNDNAIIQTKNGFQLKLST
jgi:hypothetical protein